MVLFFMVAQWAYEEAKLLNVHSTIPSSFVFKDKLTSYVQTFVHVRGKVTWFQKDIFWMLSGPGCWGECGNNHM